MHRIGKIHGSGAPGQLENPALWREDVDFIREQVDLDVLDELQRVAGALLHLQQTLHPLPGARVAAVGGLAVTLVQPVRGDAVVGHGLHFPGADLDLDGYPVHAHQHRVQGLVAIGLGNGDVVLEFTGYRLVEAVNAAQHAIAGVH